MVFNMSRTLSRAKVGQTPRIPRFGLVLSPDLRFRQVVSTDARIRSLIFAGCHPWASACYAGQAASSPIYVGWPCFAFRCYGWMRTPSAKKSLPAGMSNRSTPKKKSGVASNGQVDVNRIDREKNASRHGLSMPMQESPRSSARVPIPSRQARVPWRRWPRPVACEGHA